MKGALRLFLINHHKVHNPLCGLQRNAISFKTSKLIDLNQTSMNDWGRLKILSAFAPLWANAFLGNLSVELMANMTEVCIKEELMVIDSFRVAFSPVSKMAYLCETDYMPSFIWRKHKNGKQHVQVWEERVKSDFCKKILQTAGAKRCNY